MPLRMCRAMIAMIDWNVGCSGGLLCVLSQRREAATFGDALGDAVCASEPISSRISAL